MSTDSSTGYDPLAGISDPTLSSSFGSTSSTFAAPTNTGVTDFLTGTSSTPYDPTGATSSNSAVTDYLSGTSSTPYGPSSTDPNVGVGGQGSAGGSPISIPSSSGFNVGSMINQIGSGLGAVAGPAALLGTATLVGKNLSNNAQDYANQYKSIAAPAGAIAQQFQTQVQTGQLQPWQQATIDKMVQQEKAQAAQFGANTGTSNSTTNLGEQQQIDTNALIQQGQFQQQAFTNWQSSFGDYAKEMGLGIQAQIQGDQEIEQLWSSVLGGLAKAAAAGGGGGGGGGGGASVSKAHCFKSESGSPVSGGRLT